MFIEVIGFKTGSGVKNKIVRLVKESSFGCGLGLFLRWLIVSLF